MKKKDSLGMLGLMLVLSAAAAPAAAQDGFYLGASLGQAEFRKTCELYTAGTCDADDTAYRLFGGYRMNPNASIEVGYGAVGEVLVNAVNIAAGVPVSFEATLKALDVSLIPAYHFSDRFGIFGRIGIYRSQLEVRGTGATAGATSEHNTGLTWGAGLRFGFGRSIAARAEYQRFSSVGGSSTGEADIDFMSLGLELAF